MPEYLAPGVYVEEVPSGNKPIEGVSTSTAGVVGVTQRGPVNIPRLVTSLGEFNRVFGGYLDHRSFTGETDALPYAVEGFFNNGGQRVYVSRIIGPGRTFAGIDLYGLPMRNRASTASSQRAARDDAVIMIDDGTNIGDGDTLLLDDDVRSEYVTVASEPIAAGVRIFGALRAEQAAGTAVQVQTVTVGPVVATAGDMLAGGGLAIAPADVAGLSAGQVLRIRDTANTAITEYVTITTDAAATIAEGGLLFQHPQATTEVHRVTLTDGTATTLAAEASAGDFLLALASTADFSDNGVITVGDRIHVVRNIVSSLSIATTPLRFNHASGVAITRQVPLLRVHARDPGVWGNQLRIKAGQSSILETTVDGAVAAGATLVKLDAVFGLSLGSVLEFSRGAMMVAVARVLNVNRGSNEVELQAGLAADLRDADRVRSLEFSLAVERLENDKVVESENFENLAVDAENLHYAPRIVGAFDRAADTSGRSGASELVRLSDLTKLNDGTDIVDRRENRLSLPYASVTRWMTAGSDDFEAIDDDTYIGAASDDPEQRTGIQSLENEDAISIVAVPGRTNVTVQDALLIHCQKMRYRFAVLETPPGSSPKAAQTHRQNFDSTYGAIYYPWLTIPDRFGGKGDILNIAPSGHVLGIYARTDTQRGVFKAPANEVVRGILGFQTALTKGEQDILNPVHVNCFRDFRTANRGLRLWGARTLSSDPEWKYVNVRRLFLFLEKSIENGVQFAVFEPNSEALWATVKRSLTNFLVTIWRSGGLEGTTEEEAFFVNVGLNTMTQADIDNGRLIVTVGVAPVKPAEFVIIRISQKTREATS